MKILFKRLDAHDGGLNQDGRKIDEDGFNIQEIFRSRINRTW